jgi:fatty acid desaturase
VQLHPASYYARDLRPHLSPDSFDTVSTRLWWMVFHIACIALGTVAVTRGWFGLPGALAAALFIGHAFAGLAFVGHETLHGAVVRGPRLRHAVGFLCFLPFCVSPRLWVAWHNRLHHGNTGKVGVDPDAYPTMAQYQESRMVRIILRFAPSRSRRILGIWSLLVGFTGQSTQILLRVSRQQGYLSPREHDLAIGEWLLGIAFWVSMGFVVGWPAFLFTFAIPLAVGNAIVMAYILTNHCLSPHTEVSDPLVNSLSVTAPRLLEVLHLDFGLHVEHHLFPAMSSAHAGKVRRLLLERWPGRYRSLPFFEALGRLFKTPRVYKSDTVLVDPRDGFEIQTLVPDEVMRGVMVGSGAEMVGAP